MEGLGYVTLVDAEKLTGIKVEALKKRCQEGRINGAVKQGKTWFVPKSELIKTPGPARDTFLNGLLFTANMGIEMPVTLLVSGSWISGWLTSVKNYVEQLDADLFQGLQAARVGDSDEKSTATEEENRRLVESLLKGPQDIEKSYDELYGDRSKDPVYYDFLYLKKVRKYEGDQIEQLGDKIMRLNVSAVDGYQFGVRGHVPPDDTL